MADAKRVIEFNFAGTDSLSDKIATITKSFDKSQVSIDKFAGPIADASEKLLKLEAAVLAAGAALGIFAISEAVKFQDANTGLEQVLGDTTRSMESFGDSALDLSNKFGTAAVDVTASFASFSSAGFAADEIEGLTASVLKFATASKTDATVATDALVRILKGFNAEAKESPAILDIITRSTDIYATNVDQVSEALARSSAIAHLSNLSIAETTGVLTPMIEVFQSAEMASTAFNAVMQRLVGDNANVTEGLKKLKVAQFDASGGMRTGKDILLDVQKAYTTLDPKQKLVVTNLLAGAEHAAKFNFVFDGLAKTAEVTAKSLAGVGTAVDERLTKRMADVSFVMGLVGTQFKNAAIIAGGEFLTSINHLAGGLSPLALTLQDLAKGEQFKAFAAIVTAELVKAGYAIEAFAKALPEALQKINLTAFQEQLKLLGLSLNGLFSGIDLTTPAGLAVALQKIVDIGTQVIAFNRGMVDGLKPAIEAFELMLDAVSVLPSELLALTGVLAGLSLGWTLLSPAISLASTTLGGFGKLIGVGGDVLKGIEAASAATTIFGGSLVTTTGYIGLAAAAGYGIGTGFNFLIDKITQSTTGFSSLGDAIFFLAHDPAEGLLTSQEALAKSMAALAEEQGKTVITTQAAGIAWDVYGGGIDAITRKFEPFSLAAKQFTDALNAQQSTANTATSAYAGLTAELLRTGDAYAKVFHTFDPFAKQITEQGLAWKSAAEQVDLAKKGYFEVDGVWTQLGTSGNVLAKTTDTLSEKQEKAADKAAKLALESEKLNFEWEKLKAGQREIVFKATVDLQLAKLEHDADIFKALIESLDTAIKSTGETLLGLSKLFLDSQTKFGGTEIAALLRAEEERRKKSFELQEKLINAQLRYLQVSTDKLAKGDAIITLNAEGLEPELKAVLFKIVQLAHIEASGLAGPMLLGLPNL